MPDQKLSRKATKLFQKISTLKQLTLHNKKANEVKHGNRD